MACQTSYPEDERARYVLGKELAVPKLDGRVSSQRENEGWKQVRQREKKSNAIKGL